MNLKTLIENMNEANIEVNEPADSWGNYDFSKNSMAVIAVDNYDNGTLLHAVGGHIKFEIEEVGLKTIEELDLFPPEAGVWVWEGTYVFSPSSYEYPLDGNMWASGTWRKPTEDELKSIVNGVCPWNDDDWKLK